jgi:hypothetical protein
MCVIAPTYIGKFPVLEYNEVMLSTERLEMLNE